MLDHVETKYPFVRVYGDPGFNVDSNTRELLKASTEEELRKQATVFKDAHRHIG